MTAQDAALIVATVTSPIVAIVVSLIGYKTAKRTAETAAQAAREAATTAKETADSNRELERQKLALESSKEHTIWFMDQRRKIYLSTLEALTELERANEELYRKNTPSEKAAILEKAIEGLKDRVATLRLFASEEVVEATYRLYDSTWMIIAAVRRSDPDNDFAGSDFDGIYSDIKSFVQLMSGSLLAAPHTSDPLHDGQSQRGSSDSPQ